MARFFQHHPDGNISVQDGARAVTIPLDEWLLKADGYALPESVVGLIYQGEAPSQRCKYWYADGNVTVEPGVWHDGERWMELGLSFVEAEVSPSRQREQRLEARSNNSLDSVLDENISFLRSLPDRAMTDIQTAIGAELNAFPETKKLFLNLLSLALHLRDAVWPHLVEDALLPAAPEFRKFRVGRSAVSIGWQKIRDTGASELIGYEVAYKTPRGQWTTNTLSLQRSHIIGGLRNGTTYQIRVRAINEQGAGAWSVIREAVPGAPPDVPGSFTVTETGGEAHLVWAAPASSNGYPILHWLLRIDMGGAVRYEELAADLREHRVSVLSGVIYQFRIAAANERGIGQYSNKLEITV